MSRIDAKMTRVRTRHALTIVEVMVSVGLLSFLVGAVVWLFGYGAGATSRLTPALGLQQGSRKAVVRLLEHLQQGMEVITPRPGATSPYALVRDQVARVKWLYQVQAKDGRYELWAYTDGTRETERLLTGIKRLTFSSRTEAALQVNLVLAEGSQEHAMLTTIRLRNIVAAEEVW